MTTTVLKIIISPRSLYFMPPVFFYNMRRNKNMTKRAKIVWIPFLISYIRHFWWYRFMSKKWNDLDSSSLTWPGPKIFSCQLRIYFTNGKMILRLKAFTIFWIWWLWGSKSFGRKEAYMPSTPDQRGIKFSKPGFKVFTIFRAGLDQIKSWSLLKSSFGGDEGRKKSNPNLDNISSCFQVGWKAKICKLLFSV